MFMYIYYYKKIRKMAIMFSSISFWHLPAAQSPIVYLGFSEQIFLYSSSKLLFVPPPFNGSWSFLLLFYMEQNDELISRVYWNCYNENMNVTWFRDIWVYVPCHYSLPPMQIYAQKDLQGRLQSHHLLYSLPKHHIWNGIEQHWIPSTFVDLLTISRFQTL